MIYQIHEKHGYHMAQSKQEADANEKRGWRTVSEAEFYDRGKSREIVADQVASIEEQYERKYGKRPHHRMKRENIEQALLDNEP